jgi:hypothetical protein
VLTFGGSGRSCHQTYIRKTFGLDFTTKRHPIFNGELKLSVLLIIYFMDKIVTLMSSVTVLMIFCTAETPRFLAQEVQLHGDPIFRKEYTVQRRQCGFLPSAISVFLCSSSYTDNLGRSFIC